MQTHITRTDTLVPLWSSLSSALALWTVLAAHTHSVSTWGVWTLHGRSHTSTSIMIMIVPSIRRAPTAATNCLRSRSHGKTASMAADSCHSFFGVSHDAHVPSLPPLPVRPSLKVRQVCSICAAQVLSHLIGRAGHSVWGGAEGQDATSRLVWAEPVCCSTAVHLRVYVCSLSLIHI